MKGSRFHMRRGKRGGKHRTGESAFHISFLRGMIQQKLQKQTPTLIPMTSSFDKPYKYFDTLMGLVMAESLDIVNEELKRLGSRPSFHLSLEEWSKTSSQGNVNNGSNHLSLTFKAMQISQFNQYFNRRDNKTRSTDVSPTSPAFVYLIRPTNSIITEKEANASSSWHFALIHRHSEIPWLVLEAFIPTLQVKENVQKGISWEAIPLTSLLPTRRVWAACQRTSTHIRFDSDDESEIVKESIQSDNRFGPDCICYTKTGLNTLNESQLKAILLFANSTKILQLLQGPPGSGKTRVIVALLNLLYAPINTNSEVKSSENNNVKSIENSNVKSSENSNVKSSENSNVKSSENSKNGGVKHNEIISTTNNIVKNSNNDNQIVNEDSIDVKLEAMKEQIELATQSCTALYRHIKRQSVACIEAFENSKDSMTKQSPDNEIKSASLNVQTSTDTCKKHMRRTTMVCAPSNKAVISVLEQYLLSSVSNVDESVLCTRYNTVACEAKNKAMQEIIDAAQKVQCKQKCPNVVLISVPSALQYESNFNHRNKNISNSGNELIELSPVEGVYIHRFIFNEKVKLMAFRRQLVTLLTFDAEEFCLERDMSCKLRIGHTHKCCHTARYVHNVATIACKYVNDWFSQLKKQIPKFYKLHCATICEELKDSLITLCNESNIPENECMPKGITESNRKHKNSSNYIGWSTWPCQARSGIHLHLDHICNIIQSLMNLLDLGCDQGTDKNLVEDDLIISSDIVFCTLCVSARSSIRRLLRHIDTLIIDEAAQATEADIIQAMQLNPQKCLLVGDPFQLSSVVVSSRAAAAGLGRSMMSRLIIDCKRPYSMLRYQYRMHPEISDFPRNRFYKGRLLDDESVMLRKLVFPKNNNISNTDSCHQNIFKPLSFLDVKDGVEERHRHSGSYFNIQEAIWIPRLIWALRHYYNIDVTQRVKIITFYTAQRFKIKEALSRFKHGVENVSVHSVDSFQGSESDIIILSFVRSNVQNRIGFLSEFRRLNVALTRARMCLLCVGNMDTLSSTGQDNDLSAFVVNIYDRKLSFSSSSACVKAILKTCPYIDKYTNPKVNTSKYVRLITNTLKRKCSHIDKSKHTKIRIIQKSMSNGEKEKIQKEQKDYERQQRNFHEHQLYEDLLWETQLMWRDEYYTQNKELEECDKNGGWQVMAFDPIDSY